MSGRMQPGRNTAAVAAAAVAAAAAAASAAALVHGGAASKVAGAAAMGGPRPPSAASGVHDQRAKTILKEAVDAVVNSFAKHTQGYGRGTWLKFHSGKNRNFIKRCFLGETWGDIN